MGDLALIRRLASRHLPATLRTELYRFYSRRQIRRGTFVSREPEYPLLKNFVCAGDWAIDVGANVGHYTKILSDLVGPTGRVLAFEPIPQTFSILSSNVLIFSNQNVSSFCTAASSRFGMVGLVVPRGKASAPNFYRAGITNGKSDVLVLSVPLDFLKIPGRLALIKIDVEGHEEQVIAGSLGLLKQHRPVLVIEAGSNEASLRTTIQSLSYTVQRLPDSPNLLFVPAEIANRHGNRL